MWDRSRIKYCAAYVAKEPRPAPTLALIAEIDGNPLRLSYWTDQQLQMRRRPSKWRGVESA